MKSKQLLFFTIFCLFLSLKLMGQSVPSGYPIFEEAIRRHQLSGKFDSSYSFNLRPIQIHKKGDENKENDVHFQFGSNNYLNKDEELKGKYLFVLPIRNSIKFTSKRPYGYGDGIMIPSVGFQNLFAAGVFLKFKFLSVQLYPEFVFAENKKYEGLPIGYSDAFYKARYVNWNLGDTPERIGKIGYSKFGLGQSKITLNYGSFEVGVASQNIWWGPGQFNALIFSNNAEGFPHLTFNTTKPVKTFVGKFEGQILMGKLTNSGTEPSQIKELNEGYYNPLPSDNKYLNGIMISYNPKWIPDLFLGFTRTYQQYFEDNDGSFRYYFPIFETFTKNKLLEGGNSVEYDGRRQDQQISIFGRFNLSKANAEIYFEYGRRDHAYNWREFILNPEHARAYLLGVQKLFSLPVQNKFVQVRGEMLQQQGSINGLIRYKNNSGGAWSTHYQLRGFVNNGQPLGSGIGTGSNSQNIEISLIEDLNKFGLLFERIANHQDVYFLGLGQQSERKPWVDLSLGFLFDYQWDRFMLSSRLQFINGMNYQWQLEDNSTEEFPVGKDKFSVFAQAHLIYLIGK